MFNVSIRNMIYKLAKHWITNRKSIRIQHSADPWIMNAMRIGGVLTFYNGNTLILFSHSCFIHENIWGSRDQSHISHILKCPRCSCLLFLYLSIANCNDKRWKWEDWLKYCGTLKGSLKSEENNDILCICHMKMQKGNIIAKRNDKKIAMFAPFIC